MTDLRVFPDAEATARAAAAFLAQEIAAARRARGEVHVALAGGSTPKRTYELLGGDRDLDWSGVELWLGDERVVEDDHPESNIRTIREALAAAPLSEAQWHRVPTELGALDAAAAYSAEFEARASVTGGGLPVLDLALQGVGPDGHTASLFPDHPVLDVFDRSCAAVLDSPKPPPERVTLTLPVLGSAGWIVVLVTGAEKAPVVEQVMDGPDPAMPVSLLASETMVLLCDESAASLVSGDGA
ncbi:MAG: 6-phosphogluconolactonase [Solirubrobacteraceae bacterium]